MKKPLDTATEQLIDELREAALQAGVRADDPIVPLLRGLVRAIRHVGERTARSDRIAMEASRRIAKVMSDSRHAADAEADRFRLELTRVETDTIQRIAAAIVETTNVAWTRRVRTFDRNTACLAALTIFAVASACLAGGIWWGQSQALASFHETEIALQAAFLDGPETARAWNQMISWNDLRGSLDACNASPARIHLQDARRFCDVPLWIERLPNTKPPRP
jgi:hypothetical protein